MGIGEILPSVHRHNGWKGQYFRMIRWYKKFEGTNPGNFEDLDIYHMHDVMFVCFQNIYIFKDWLHHAALIPIKKLNKFINENLELQICRDIANGTKHFNLNSASVDNDFTIIREYNPFHEILEEQSNKIIILIGGHKFELKELALRCIDLWKKFLIVEKLIPYNPGSDGVSFNSDTTKK